MPVPDASVDAYFSEDPVLFLGVDISQELHVLRWNSKAVAIHDGRLTTLGHLQVGVDMDATGCFRVLHMRHCTVAGVKM